MNTKQNIIDQHDSIQNIKNSYKACIQKYTDLLAELNKREEALTKQLRILATADTSSMHQELKKTHKKQKLNKQYEKLMETRLDCISTIEEIKTKYDHLMLSTDTILFNNIVMLDKICKNFKELSHIEKRLK